MALLIFFQLFFYPPNEIQCYTMFYSSLLPFNSSGPFFHVIKLQLQRVLMPRLHRSQSCWMLAWAMAPCHSRPPWFGYFRRKEDVSSKPNSDCLGFGLSKQWLEVFPSENALIGRRAQMSVCLSCARVGGASASQVEEGVPRNSSGASSWTSLTQRVQLPALTQEHQGPSTSPGSEFTE